MEENNQSEIVQTVTPLRRLQLCELEILNQFVAICEKHSLRYFLVGGTLLGAVRHQGFIPWDDDIDVGMLREDYNKFSEIAQDELGEQYFFQSYHTDPHYFLTYSKIRQNGTEIYEERFQNAKFHKGIFIDIFPLDYCPKPGVLSHFLFNVLAVMNYRGQVDSGEVYTPYAEISGKIGYGILKILNKKQVISARCLVIKLAHILSRRHSVANYSGAYGYFHEISPWHRYATHDVLQFEGEEYTVPHTAVMQLMTLYGPDYETLPSVDKRRTHCILDKSQI